MDEWANDEWANDEWANDEWANDECVNNRIEHGSRYCIGVLICPVCLS